MHTATLAVAPLAAALQACTSDTPSGPSWPLGPRIAMVGEAIDLTA